jgi:predicted SprT family Zn-dependent metalloprotease
MHPTSETYQSLEIAFDHFNRALFDNELPRVVFTVQRKKGVMGYFAPERWGNIDGERCHEISINPSYIANSRLIEVMQTLVHEMAHCWQFSFGSPSKDHYHNKEWAYKMIQIGLMPSSTGEPGGAIIGRNMGDYIVEGGKFLNAFSALNDNGKFKLTWVDRRALPRLYDPVIANPDNVKASYETSVLVNRDEIFQDKPSIQELEQGAVPVHFIEPDSTTFVDKMPKTFYIEEPSVRQTRYRYVCYGCHSKLYGKRNLNIRCEDCNQVFRYETM